MSIPHIITKTLSNGRVGQSYNQLIGVVGGFPPYKWSAKGLPSGLSIKSGDIIGTPTKAGTYKVTIGVTDVSQQTATANFTLIVTSPLSITTTSLPNAVQGQAYSFALAATGGNSPYTWSVSSGSLPAGLTLSPAGVISGTATVSGSFAVTFKVVDNS